MKCWFCLSCHLYFCISCLKLCQVPVIPFVLKEIHSNVYLFALIELICGIYHVAQQSCIQIRKQSRSLHILLPLPAFLEFNLILNLFGNTIPISHFLCETLLQNSIVQKCLIFASLQALVVSLNFLFVF